MEKTGQQKKKFVSGSTSFDVKGTVTHTHTFNYIGTHTHTDHCDQHIRFPSSECFFFFFFWIQIMKKRKKNFYPKNSCTDWIDQVSILTLWLNRNINSMCLLFPYRKERETKWNRKRKLGSSSFYYYYFIWWYSQCEYGGEKKKIKTPLNMVNRKGEKKLDKIIDNDKCDKKRSKKPNIMWWWNDEWTKWWIEMGCSQFNIWCAWLNEILKKKNFIWIWYFFIPRKPNYIQS